MQGPDELALARSPSLWRNVADGDIVLVRWPQEVEQRQRAAAEGRARLLLIEDVAPALWDSLEDWVRLPVDPVDLEARRARLMDVVEQRRPVTRDEHGLVRRGRSWVALSPQEEQLFTPLFENLDHVVRREVLSAALYGASDDAGNSLDSAIRRLRVRIAPLGLTIRLVRPIGYALRVDVPPARE